VEKVPRWKRLARSLSQAKETSSDSQPLPRPKPRFRNDGRNRHSSKDHSRSTSPSPRTRRRSIGDHSVPKLTPVQRMRAAARTMTGSAPSGDVSKGERVKEKTGSSLLSKKHGSSKKRRAAAAAAQEELPGCLDPKIAENHRQSLLAKYYNPKAMKRPSLARQSPLAASTSQTDVGEDNLSEASDETLTNDTASVDTAHEPLDEPQSTVADKTAALEQDRPSTPLCNTRKEVSEPTETRPESWIVV